MKIILLGDSITQGLGSKKINFTEELGNLLGKKYEIVNMAKTGTTIRYVDEIRTQIMKEKPDCVVCLYGNVDAQIRPNRKGKIFPKLPKRFQLNNGSMISPRPFYSHVLYKYVLQKIENLFRTIFRNIIYRIDGTEQWMDIKEYELKLCELQEFFAENNIEFFSCSTVYIDDKLFPGSVNEYERFNKIIEQCISKTSHFIDLYNPLREKVEIFGWNSIYNSDHFHPNGEGYKLIATIIAKAIIV